MLHENVVVVGGGIAGITAAYFEAKKGNHVTILETSSHLGGLLQSDYLHGQYFDYGTHLLAQTGEIELDQFLFSEFNSDNCNMMTSINAGNYFNGKMNHQSCYIDSKTMNQNDYNQACLELLSSMDQPQGKNLEEFLLHKFGRTFYANIHRPVIKKYFGVEPKYLATKTANFFDMSRLLVFDDLTTKRLCKLDGYDDRLGHHHREEGVVKYYPKDCGIGQLINFLVQKLEYQNVNIRYLTNLQTIEHSKGRVTQVSANNGAFKVDKLIWTVPIGILSRIANIGESIDSPTFRATGLYNFTFDKPLNSKAAFINVPDIAMHSSRVTLYQNLSDPTNYSCTVEVLTDSVAILKDLIYEVHQELIQMGLIGEEYKCIFKHYRVLKYGFPVLTKDFMVRDSEVSGFCDSYFSNVLFLGRSNNKTFFMNEVLIDAYRRIMNGEN